jgi:hypothetical protein
MTSLMLMELRPATNNRIGTTGREDTAESNVLKGTNISMVKIRSHGHCVLHLKLRALFVNEITVDAPALDTKEKVES